VLKAREVAACCHRGDGDGALDTTQALAGVDDRGAPPGLDLVVQCQLKALQTGRVCGDRGHVFLQDARLCRGWDRRPRCALGGGQGPRWLGPSSG
jgi:hypothetical protein